VAKNTGLARTSEAVLTDRVIIERLEFQGYCGVSEDERTTLQPMAADLQLALDTSQAAASDDLGRTVDYARVAEQVIAIAQSEQFSLLESLAERLAQAILSGFNVMQVDLWVRKLKPPVKGVRESVGVRIIRQADPRSCDADVGPAGWLVQHRRLLRPGRALDLACGQGRNALYLVQEGFRVEAWDRAADSLEALRSKARALGLGTITTRLVDLEREPHIPVASFDLITVFRYLQRDLIPQIIEALKPDGIVVYETFLIDNHERFDHPHRREFCVDRNELLSLFGKLRLLAYQEGPVEPDRGPYLASLVAQRSR
jgi:dihydroneopterin aldolase